MASRPEQLYKEDFYVWTRDQARRSAEASLRVHAEDAAAGALPAKCPYRLADLLRHDWHPASRHGLAP